MAVQKLDLENIFRMTNPQDFAGSIGVTGDDKHSSVVKYLIDITLNMNAMGILGTAALRDELKRIVTDPKEFPTSDDKVKSERRKQFFKLFRFYSTLGAIDLPDQPEIKEAWSYKNSAGKDETAKDLKSIIGVSDLGNKPISIVLSNSPYVHPSVRNVEKAEIFLSGIPTVIMSRCVPYLDVEFQFDRKISPRLSRQLSTPGLLKFLLGTGDKDTSTASNKAMIDAHSRKNAADKDSEYTFAGMEMFTAPQTLVNPMPLAEGSRYVPVLDAFRPFMSLEGVEISVTPAVGMYSYKKAKMTFKLHDRSRLSEISDLVKPDVYTRTTIWLTYGWRHPDEPKDPYAQFINNNMMAREAYGIFNSSFAFEQSGGVSVVIEMYTKGISELQTVKVDEALDSPTTKMKQLEQLRTDIARFRQLKGHDPSNGASTEIRPLQLLDAASQGVQFDFGKDAQNTVNQLISIIKRSDLEIPGELQQRLEDSLKTIYDPDPKKRGAKSFLEELKRTVRASIDAKFKEARKGADPFLPKEDKKDKNNPQNLLFNLVSNGNKHGRSKDKEHLNKYVSFGKVFSTFALPAFVTSDSADDIQIFFYVLNDQAGPARGTNIAEFPIEMPRFINQWTEHVLRRGTEQLTIEEFLRVLVDGQLNDVRSQSYDLHRLLEPYGDSKELRAKAGSETSVEKKGAELLKDHGIFKKPVIEMYVESLPERSTALVGAVNLEASAADPKNTVDATAKRRIMRIHVYDKQVHPYKAAAAVLKADDGDTRFYEVSQNFMQEARGSAESKKADKNNATLQDDLARQLAGQARSRSSVVLNNNEAIKQAVARTVPTIVYGSNATGLISAALTSQHDALLGTVQMLRAGKQNTTSPNGSGVGGIPLRVIPTTLNVTTFGCPLLGLTQLYFFDFNTGTTADNLYIVTQLTHAFSPGKYQSSMNLTCADAYGKYESATTFLDTFKRMIKDQQADTPAKNRKDKKAGKKKIGRPEPTVVGSEL